MSNYQTPAGPARFEYEIKKSRFIGMIAACTSREAAMQHVASARAEFPDARHVCWAFVCGTPGNYADYGFSDDGEPGGTAGKPILNVLQHNPVSDLCAIVVRYFGGIKLGAGGLVRAYSSATSSTLDITPLQAVVEMATLNIDVPYPLEDRLRRLIADFHGEVRDCQYGVSVILSCEVPLPAVEELETAAIDCGRGEVRCRRPD